MAQDQKRNAIIGAAKKRFIHFGVGKTTMNEVADDLSISKASIYYYFPDKLSLYAAVLQDIIEASKTGEDAYLSENNPLKAISAYLESRTQFILQFYNILEYLKTMNRNVPKELDTIFSAARSREIDVMIAILNNAASTNALQFSNARNTAELFLDCLEGIRFSSLAHKENFFPDKKELLAILKRELDFSAIFLKGITG